MDWEREHETTSKEVRVWKTRAIVDHTNSLVTKNIRIFLQLKDVQVYQIAIHPCTKNSPKKFNSLVILKLAFAPSS